MAWGSRIALPSPPCSWPCRSPGAREERPRVALTALAPGFGFTFPDDPEIGGFAARVIAAVEAGETAAER